MKQTSVFVPEMSCCRELRDIASRCRTAAVAGVLVLVRVVDAFAP